MRSAFKIMWAILLSVAAVGLLMGFATIGITPWGVVSLRVMDLLAAVLIFALALGVWLAKPWAWYASGLLAAACLIVDGVGLIAQRSPVYVPGVVVGVLGLAFVLSARKTASS